MKVYGYLRVSTMRQVNEGESLEVQRRQIEGYALQHALKLPIGSRPAGASLMERLEPGDILIAAKLDRLFRSALDALKCVEEMKSRGVKVHLLDLGGDIAANGLSRLFLTIVAAFAEAERDRIRERVSQVKLDQKRRGRYLGGVAPFGFTIGVDGALYECPGEQAAVEDIKRWSASGRSLRTIASDLAERYANLPDVRPLSHVGVRNVLARKPEAVPLPRVS